MSDERELTVALSELRKTLGGLKKDGFNMLVDLSAVDYLDYAGEKTRELVENYGTTAAPAGGLDVLTHAVKAAPYERPGAELAGENELFERSCAPAALPARYRVIYRLMKLDLHTGLIAERATVSCWLEPGEAPLSARDLWANADWLERELWDMFGVPIADRPAIKRILMYESFEGHALRKDYPIKRRQPLVGPKDSELEQRDRMLDENLRPKVAG